MPLSCNFHDSLVLWRYINYPTHHRHHHHWIMRAYRAHACTHTHKHTHTHTHTRTRTHTSMEKMCVFLFLLLFCRRYSNFIDKIEISFWKMWFLFCLKLASMAEKTKLRSRRVLELPETPTTKQTSEEGLAKVSHNTLTSFKALRFRDGEVWTRIVWFSWL